jgi:hypothetical protein
MTRSSGGKGTEYNGSDILIQEISLERIIILLKVWTVIFVFRLRRQL